MFSSKIYEGPRSLLQRYRTFLKKNKRKKISTKSISATLAISILESTPEKRCTDSSTVLPVKGELKLLKGDISLRPESLLYLFKIDKTAKNLFLFCLQIKMDSETLTFTWNSKDVQDFIEFCRMFGTPPAPVTVKDSMKLLVSQNLTRSIKNRLYMVNPMIVSCSDAKTNELFQKYTDSIVEKELKDGKLGGIIQEKLFPRLEESE